MRSFLAQNAMLAKRYDGDGPEYYFDDDFDRYPEVTTDIDIDSRVDLKRLESAVQANR